uniref:Uncharacterized protein n=1 Tax=Esox lucius TaxID=8010 RepID=A0A3P8XE09_ESOLU
MVSKEPNHLLTGQHTNSKTADKLPGAMTVRSVLLNRDSPDIESRLKRRRNRTHQVRFKDLEDGVGGGTPGAGAETEGHQRTAAERDSPHPLRKSSPTSPVAAQGWLTESTVGGEGSSNQTSVVGAVRGDMADTIEVVAAFLARAPPHPLTPGPTRRCWAPPPSPPRPCSLTLPFSRRRCSSTAIQTSPCLQKPKNPEALATRSRSEGKSAGVDLDDGLDEYTTHNHVSETASCDGISPGPKTKQDLVDQPRANASSLVFRNHSVNSWHDSDSTQPVRLRDTAEPCYCDSVTCGSEGSKREGSATPSQARRRKRMNRAVSDPGREVCYCNTPTQTDSPCVSPPETPPPSTVQPCSSQTQTDSPCDSPPPSTVRPSIAKTQTMPLYASLTRTAPVSPHPRCETPPMVVLSRNSLPRTESNCTHPFNRSEVPPTVLPSQVLTTLLQTETVPSSICQNQIKPPCTTTTTTNCPFPPQTPTPAPLTAPACPTPTLTPTKVPFTAPACPTPTPTPTAVPFTVPACPTPTPTPTKVPFTAPACPTPTPTPTAVPFTAPACPTPKPTPTAVPLTAPACPTPKPTPTAVPFTAPACPTLTSTPTAFPFTAPACPTPKPSLTAVPFTAPACPTPTPTPTAVPFIAPTYSTPTLTCTAVPFIAPTYSTPTLTSTAVHFIAPACPTPRPTSTAVPFTAPTCPTPTPSLTIAPCTIITQTVTPCSLNQSMSSCASPPPTVTSCHPPALATPPYISLIQTIPPGNPPCQTVPPCSFQPPAVPSYSTHIQIQTIKYCSSPSTTVKSGNPLPPMVKSHHTLPTTPYCGTPTKTVPLYASTFRPAPPYTPPPQAQPSSAEDRRASEWECRGERRILPPPPPPPPPYTPRKGGLSCTPEQDRRAPLLRRASEKERSARSESPVPSPRANSLKHRAQTPPVIPLKGTQGDHCFSPTKGIPRPTCLGQAQAQLGAQLGALHKMLCSGPNTPNSQQALPSGQCPSGAQGCSGTGSGPTAGPLTSTQADTLRQVQEILGGLVSGARSKLDPSWVAEKLMGPNGPLHDIRSLQTQLHSLEGVLETSQNTIKVLLDVIQDLEKKEAERDGRHSYRTGQDIENCGTCRDCACIIYRVYEDSSLIRSPNKPLSLPHKCGA